MLTIDELREKYFLTPDDFISPTVNEVQATNLVPETSNGVSITPLIDYKDYFDELAFALHEVGNGAKPADNKGQFVYICGWVIGIAGTRNLNLPKLKTDDEGNLKTDWGDTKPLIDILAEKVTQGVEVRVLGWVSISVMGSEWVQDQDGSKTVREANIATLSSLYLLRMRGISCAINILDHTVGSSHTKLVLIRDSNGLKTYTGGFDLDPNRREPHWHDVQLKVQGGTAAQSIYTFFQLLWDEVHENRRMTTIRVRDIQLPSSPQTSIAVPSIVPENGLVPVAQDRNFNTGVHGETPVQLLQTIPVFRYSPFNTDCIVPEKQPISFAFNGRFQISKALQKAILLAEQFIYMEDQFFWSNEVMGWLNQALKIKPELKIILVTGEKNFQKFDNQYQEYMRTAINENLIQDLPPEDFDRIRLMNIKTRKVHAKTTIIDDEWAIIGSANCARRSLYTDIEHSVSFIGLPEGVVRDYRVQLWGKHFHLEKEQHKLLNHLQHALNIWHHEWGTEAPEHIPVDVSLLKPLSLPLPISVTDTVVDAVAELIHDYIRDSINDADSREEWGGFLVP